MTLACAEVDSSLSGGLPLTPSPSPSPLTTTAGEGTWPQFPCRGLPTNEGYLEARRATGAACAAGDHPGLLASRGTGGTAHARELQTWRWLGHGVLESMRGVGGRALTGRDRMLGLLERSGRGEDDGIKRGSGRAYGWADVISRSRGIVG